MAAPTHSSPAQGFYVFQTALGSPLQFHPALGTGELDSLMDAYLPCPGAIQDKRASVSVDFLEHYRCTGESIKFYQVPDYWVGSATGSPNSARDSGYGSSFTASPMASTWSWGPALTTAAAVAAAAATAASTPSTSSSAASTPHIPSQAPSRRRKQPSARPDFSDLPGMKILTKDGRDVTNTVTRGCKTKEQRDHAHLMRIVKACDSCKKKKVRCDPSHRTRAGLASPAAAALRRHPAKEAKTPGQARRPQIPVPSPLEPAVPGEFALIPPLTHSFELEPFDFLYETPADELASWDEFLSSHGEPSAVFSGGLDRLPDVQGQLDSPRRPLVPSTGGDSGGWAQAVVNKEGVAPSADAPDLPYLERNRAPHCYVDFSLFSPQSSFSDAEPVFSGDLRDGYDARRTQTGHHSRDATANQALAMATAGSPERGLHTRSPDHRERLRSSRLQTWLSASSPQSRPDLVSFGPAATVATEPLPTSQRSSPAGLSDTNGRRLVTNANVAQCSEGQTPPSLSSASPASRFESDSAVYTEAHGANLRGPARAPGASSPWFDTTECRDGVIRHPSSGLAAPADIQARMDGGMRVRARTRPPCRHLSFEVSDYRPVRTATARSAASTPMGRKPSCLGAAAATQARLAGLGATESTAVPAPTEPTAAFSPPLETASRLTAPASRVVDETRAKSRSTAAGTSELTTMGDRTSPKSTSEPSPSAVPFATTIAAAFGLAAALWCITGLLSAGTDLLAAAVVYALLPRSSRRKADGPGASVRGLLARRRAVDRVETALGRIGALV